MRKVLRKGIVYAPVKLCISSASIIFDSYFFLKESILDSIKYYDFEYLFLTAVRFACKFVSVSPPSNNA
jgi:hypothetical protein